MKLNVVWEMSAETLGGSGDGGPAVSICCGFSEAGLPLSLQIAALIKWAGMTLSEAQSDQLCEAYPHAERMIERLPRDRSRRDEPANVFEFPSEDAEQ